MLDGSTLACDHTTSLIPTPFILAIRVNGYFALYFRHYTLVSKADNRNVAIYSIVYCLSAIEPFHFLIHHGARNKIN